MHHQDHPGFEFLTQSGVKLKSGEVTLVHSATIREALERRIGPIVKPQEVKDVQKRPLIVDVTGCSYDPSLGDEDDVYLIGFIEHRGQTVLHMPRVKDEFRDAIEGIKRSHGLRLGPIEAKEAWLKVDSFEKIADRAHIKIAQAPPPKIDGPKFNGMREFLSHPTVVAFGKMDGVLPAATIALLEGFVKVDLPKSAVVDHAYQRMFEAMKSYKDPITSSAEIEVIHQEIQNLLGIAQPYKPGDLEKAIAARVPTDLEVTGFAKPSAMNALASVVSAVEKQKGGPIKVVMQEETYYESEYVVNDYTELSD